MKKDLCLPNLILALKLGTLKALVVQPEIELVSRSFKFVCSSCLMGLEHYNSFSRNLQKGFFVSSAA